jgi:hypothetical protein
MLRLGQVHHMGPYGFPLASETCILPTELPRRQITLSQGVCDVILFSGALCGVSDILLSEITLLLHSTGGQSQTGRTRSRCRS